MEEKKEEKPAPKPAAVPEQTNEQANPYDPSDVNVSGVENYSIVIEYANSAGFHAWNSRMDDSKYDSYA